MEVLGNLHYVLECQNDKLAIMLSKIQQRQRKINCCKAFELQRVNEDEATTFRSSFITQF